MSFTTAMSGGLNTACGTRKTPVIKYEASYHDYINRRCESTRTNQSINVNLSTRNLQTIQASTKSSSDLSKQPAQNSKILTKNKSWSCLGPKTASIEAAKRASTNFYKRNSLTPQTGN